LTQLLPKLHATHSAPPSPHPVLFVPAWQTPVASQQPFGQLAASQTHAPSTHPCPDGHATQAAPFAPHAAVVGDVTQVAPLQQPFVQSPAPQYATHA
jgi:hypothetical protein